ncbi:MAG: hypothetical protein ACI9XC_002247 [Gammaproteobacteria bacterium]|jgi:hypothetical protein
MIYIETNKTGMNTKTNKSIATGQGLTPLNVAFLIDSTLQAGCCSGISKLNPPPKDYA